MSTTDSIADIALLPLSRCSFFLFFSCLLPFPLTPFLLSSLLTLLRFQIRRRRSGKRHWTLRRLRRNSSDCKRWVAYPPLSRPRSLTMSFFLSHTLSFLLFPTAMRTCDAYYYIVLFSSAEMTSFDKQYAPTVPLPIQLYLTLLFLPLSLTHSHSVSHPHPTPPSALSLISSRLYVAHSSNHIVTPSGPAVGRGGPVEN